MAQGCWNLFKVVGLFGRVLNSDPPANDAHRPDVYGRERRERLHKLLAADVRSSRVIKRILVRCPTTKKLNATGMVIEEDVFAATEVRSGTVACVHCGEKHAWNKTEVILAR
jgi:hypothetical protein